VGYDDTIRALPTDYAGIRFRSRTEARWAVFFDALGIRWEYEPEGYRLPDGTCYLADFACGVNGGRLWIEVKGQVPSPVETAKCIALSRGADAAGLLVEGAPHPDGPLWRVTPDGGVRRVTLAGSFPDGDVAFAAGRARESFAGLGGVPRTDVHGPRLPSDGTLSPEILKILREKQRLRDQRAPLTWEG